jgi:hypothetical protein
MGDSNTGVLTVICRPAKAIEREFKYKKKGSCDTQKG